MLDIEAALDPQLGYTYRGLQELATGFRTDTRAGSEYEERWQLIEEREGLGNLDRINKQRIGIKQK